MAAYVFTPTAVAAFAKVRFDTASGSNTPATIYPQHYGFTLPGAVLTADAAGNLPRIESDTATLYQKTLDYRGVTVTATATLTGAATPSGAPAGTPAALAADAAFTGTYAPIAGPLQNLAAKLNAQAGTCNVFLAGDSTGDEPQEWFYRAWQTFASTRPWITLNYYLWSDASQAYGSVSTIQSGTATAWNAEAIYDSFTRTATELNGSTPDKSAGYNWSGATGQWTINGTALASKQGASTASYIGVTSNVTGTDVTVSGTLDFDTTAAASTKRLEFWLGGGTTSSVRLWIRVSNAGAITWGIDKNMTGTGFATIATGGGTPLASGVNNTNIAYSLRMNGTAVTAVLNGVTVTATLTAQDLTTINAATNVYLSLGGGGTADGQIKVNDLRVEVGQTEAVQIVNVYNGSRAGSVLQYQQDRIAAMLPAGTAFDAVFVSSSHNYTSTDATTYATTVKTFLAAVKAAHPEAGFVLSSQNPEMPPNASRSAHRDRCAALKTLAAQIGAGYIAAYEAFIAASNRGARLVRGDSIHPNSASEIADPNNGDYVWMTAALAWLNALVA